MGFLSNAKTCRDRFHTFIIQTLVRIRAIFSIKYWSVVQDTNFRGLDRWTIIRRRRSEFCGIIPETKSSGIFHNIHWASVVLFEVEFSFNRDYQLFKSIEKRREAVILKFSALIIITSREVIKARYSVILNQSERAHLYNRWAIKLKAFRRRIRSCFTNVCYIASRSLFSFCWRPHTILITTTQALIPIVFKYRLTMKSFLHCKCLHYFLLVPIKPIGYFQYY